ncbi:hypothetical protein [Streptomyces venezuelae]|nr:hypothetical protein [Streptomyces venezuelae]
MGALAAETSSTESRRATTTVLRAVPFREEIHLPAPFDLALDTAEFPVS